MMTVRMILLFASLALAQNAYASERRVSGTIVKVDCGDGTNLAIQHRKNTKPIQGVCYEKWCDGLCGDIAKITGGSVVGRKVSASIRVVDTEEPGSGAISNEFFNIILE